MRFFGILYVIAVNLYATTITLTSPVLPITLKDGDEYFMDVMNNPIDFDKRRDIMWEENFYENSIKVLNNTWQGTYAVGGYLMPLFQGMDGAIQNGLIGNNYPLDSSKYTMVSILSKVAQRYNPDLTSWYTLFWSHDSTYHNATWQNMAAIDGYQLRVTGEVLMYPDDKYINYIYDLSSNTEWKSSSIRGIKLSPSNQASPSVRYQSIRIFDPLTSPQLIVTWSTTDLPTSASTVPQVEIYVDTDNQNYDGVLLSTFSGGSSFFRERAVDLNETTILTAALAAGEYYIYLKLYSDYDTNDSNTDALLATSNYSEKITINGKSQVIFENPSMYSGDDYATKVLNNPWDMNGSSDIKNMYNIGSSQFNSGIFTATATAGDPYFFLNVDTSNPIKTSLYRYVSFTMEINDSSVVSDPNVNFEGNIAEKVGIGWMGRFFWGATDIDANSVSADIVFYEGVHTYTIDLMSNVADETITNPTLWTSNSTNGFFRFDPLEVPANTEFYIHDFKLTANPEPDSNGKFTIQFTLNDKENDTANISFYRDNDRAGFDGVFIGSKNYTSGSNSYVFDTCGLSVGEYFIYFIAKDSVGNETKYYVDVAISIKTTTNCKSDILDLYIMEILPSIIATKDF